MQTCLLAYVFVMASGSHYFIAGATGATGQRMVNQLLNDPSVTRVTAAVRDTAAAPFAPSDRLELVEVDYTHMTYCTALTGEVFVTQWLPELFITF